MINEMWIPTITIGTLAVDREINLLSCIFYGLSICQKLVYPTFHA